METFETARSKLLALRKRVQVLYLILAALYVVAFVCLLLSYRMVGVVMALINVALYLFVVRRQAKAYEQAMAQACVRFGTAAPWQNVQFTPEGGPTQAEVEQLQLLPMHTGQNVLLHRNSFTATANGLTLQASEVTLHYPAKVGKRDSYRFLSGTLLTARHPANSAGADWLLVKKDGVDAEALQKFVQQCHYRVAAAPAELDEGYALYTHADSAAPPRTVARQVAKLSGLGQGFTALRLWPEGAALFLDKRFFTGRYRPRTEPEEALLRANGLPERDEALELFRRWAAYTEQA